MSAPSKVGYLEIVGANVSNGEHDPGGSSWSMAGAHFDELVDTKRPIDPRLRMAAMEQADRKSLLPVTLQTCPKLFRRQRQQYGWVAAD